MLGRTLVASIVVLVTLAVADGLTSTEARASGQGQPTNWNRFYYYPYVYYPHNFRRSDQQYITCTTGIPSTAGFRCTTRTGTTSIRASGLITAGTTSFWTSSDSGGDCCERHRLPQGLQRR